MDKTKTEADWYKFWEKSGFFKADPKSDKKPYSLLMPPPNLTGDPHLGHAMQHAILDSLARFKRMQGYDTLLLPGVDHAGIQFEGTFTKLLAKENLSKYNLSREEWLKKAWQFRDDVYKAFHQTWSIFGISADWSREVFTLEEKVQTGVVEEFQTFWDQDLLYKGAYIVQWCPKCGTAIEDLEMEYEERKEKLYYINYLIDGLPNPEYITIATARPETIAADVAIAIYPKHPKYAKFIGKKAINPFTQTELPIIEDKRVEKDFGTGALKITPGHDLLDYEIGKDHNLAILHVVGKDGKITELDDHLKGLNIIEAREKAVGKLHELGLLDKAEDYSHSVPICERSKNAVEPLISEEWFIKMQPLADKALKHIKEVGFAPKNYQKILTDWIEKIHDWSISRSLWWGHRIPVWYCQKSNPHHSVGKNQDLTISLNKPTIKCPNCGSTEWVQDDQVLDTWFSSGMWPMITLGWPKETEDFKKYFPWDFEISAPEIRYLWIARMIMLSLWFKDQIPFKDMFFHGTLRAMDGKKMSKSLGNGIFPKDLIDQWGTDSTRMFLYSYAAPGRDGRLNRQIADERCKNFRNFGTKLRNIERFIVELKPEGADESEGKEGLDDKNIKDELNQTITKVTSHLESFNLHLATEEIYDFLWHKFADVYIEKTKDRRAEAQPTLEYVFKTALELLHPFMPFITEELWQKLPHQGQSIMLAEWPKVE